MLFIAAAALGQESPSRGQDQEAVLIGVLKSDAPLKDKADACRGLGAVGTKMAVAPLAALLGDEKLSHMARYGLEPIPDPSVDEALRGALGKLKGRTLLGVIGSIGVRRDLKAVDQLAALLKDADADVAGASALALGMIGSPLAAKALEQNISSTPAANRPAVYEGLFRCAEALLAHGQRGEAVAIYERANRPEAPSQVREAAARKARALRQEEGPRL
jgi:HEAT repeat protein